MTYEIELGRCASVSPITDSESLTDPLRPRGKKGRAISLDRRPRVAWNAAKDARLREMFAGGASREQMALVLSNEFEADAITADQVKHRCQKLGLLRDIARWTPETDSALSGFIMSGISFREAAPLINARFGTSFTRSALIGRAHRLGHVGEPRPKLTQEQKEARRLAVMRRRNNMRREVRRREGRPQRLSRLIPRIPREEAILRCAAIEPRHATIMEVTGCRWPYGDGPFTFCDHPKEGSGHPSYCLAHHQLSLKGLL